jgi:hypothetical protein
MAISCKNSTRSRRRRSIAVFGAALILVAQFVAAVHWHPAVELAWTVASAQPLETGLCALCQVAFHSSLNPTPTRAPFLEPLEIGSVIASTDSWLGFASFDSASALTRAPPAAA